MEANGWYNIYHDGKKNLLTKFKFTLGEKNNSSFLQLLVLLWQPLLQKKKTLNLKQLC